MPAGTSAASQALPEVNSDAILGTIVDGLVMYDLTGHVQYSNATFNAMIGRPGEDLRGKTIDQLFDSTTALRLNPTLSDCADAVQVHFNVEVPNAEGRTRAFCLTGSPVHDAAGRTIGILQNFRGMDTLRDIILDLREVNDAISREKEKTEQIIDSIADGIFTVDEQLRIRSFSPRLERLTGIKAADAQGHSCAEVLSGTKCRTDCPIRWTLEHGAVVERCREVLHLADGRTLPVSITTSFLHDARGGVDGLIGVVRDFSEIEQLRGELGERNRRHNLIGRSPATHALVQTIDAVADSDATVLITGETGTGKELVARAIHGASRRRERPFVSLNCAALNENLLESELFGHVRGSFTGAVHDKAGRFEVADGGTIFLDEIGDTTPALQAKLLRVLQEKAFERVGDTRTRQVNVRVIAATNRDLLQMARAGQFREDLYYRLAVVPITVPPLRERLEDVPLLVEHFIERFRPRYFAGREEAFEGISNRALALMLEYSWPGNVRELEHAIEYAMVSSTTNRIERAFLPAPLRQLQPPEAGPDALAAAAADRPNEDDPAVNLRAVLERHRWNASRAARALGVSRTTLWRRMKQLGLIAPR